MVSIQPCRSQISERFPVASFNIEVPESRLFEVACATDPRLFHVNFERQRSPRNFFTTRGGGLLRAPKGRTAWILPPQQLRKFAGARRIYYALGTYGSVNGAQPYFTISPGALDQVPSISLSPDFTGRSLDRARLGLAPTHAVYGAAGTGGLRWGGDDVLQSQRALAPSPSDDAYDDGHPSDLWERQAKAPSYVGSSPSEGRANGNGGTVAPDQDAYDAGIGAETRAPAAAAAAYAYARSNGGGTQQDPIPDMAAYDEGLRGDAGPFEGSAGYAGRHQYGGRAAALEEMHGAEDAAELNGDAGYDDYDEGIGAESDVDTEEPPGVADVSDAEPEARESDKVAGRTSSPPASAKASTGRHPGYRESFAEERAAAIGIAPRALSIVALDIPEKVRILRVVARGESGEEGYAAINPDREFNDPSHPAYQNYHIGLSWGLIQFTQRSGALGRVLRAAKRREAELTDLPPQHRFDALLGPNAEELLRVTNAATPEERVAPVGGANLWEPAWTERFRAAGAVPYFTWAQNEVAVTEAFDPQLRYARWLGFDTPRALALLVDRAIHMGEAGGLEWVLRAVGPVRTEADRAAALSALGHADLRAFQATFAPDLPLDGVWSAPTHAAMTFALRSLGDRSPVPIEGRDALVARLVAAARTEGFGPRVEQLAQDPELGDADTYALA